MMRATHLQTTRLSLRPPRKGDLWFIYKLLGNPKVRRYLGGPVTRIDRIKRLPSYLIPQTSETTWVAHLTPQNQPIGVIQLSPHKDGQDHEISYQFDPAVWGQGLAGEAVQALIIHGLHTCGLPRIIAETQSANTASCRLLAAQGMTELKRLQRFGAEQIIFATPHRSPK